MTPHDPTISGVSSGVSSQGATSVSSDNMPTNGASPIETPRRKPLLWSALSLLTIGVAVAIVFLSKNHNQTHTVQQLKTYGGSITAAEVAKLNPTDTFYTVFAHAAEQSVVTTTSSFYSSNSSNDYSQQGDLRRVVFDYASKKFSFESNIAGLISRNSVDEQRCVGSQEYEYLSDFSDEGWQKSDDSRDCTSQALPLEGLNDGLNTGGLSTTEAQLFTQSLRKQSGLVTVNGLQLTQQTGKSLLRFDVTVSPINTSGYGYLGLQHFIWAFKDTGKDPTTWPYTYIGAGSDGVRLAYYVDPGAQLPVYAQLRTTNGLDDKGRPMAGGQPYDYEHVEYSFGGTVPTLTLNDHTPLKLSWPIDKKL